MVRRFLPCATILCCILSACASHPVETSYVGVMVDNHQLARPYQRGLDAAAWVEEQFAEGGITRFEAVFDARDFPVSVGPVRSVRSYFIDGVSPAVAAIFHIGGSPDALDRLAEEGAVPSFNAIHFDRFFAYDDTAPAPHHRFLTRVGFDELFARVEAPAMSPFPFSVVHSFESDADAKAVAIDMGSEAHDVAYGYEPSGKRYVRRNRGMRQASMPSNVLVIETDVAVAGELGRLSIRTEGSGSALLFRDGGVKEGEWSKRDGEFFSFTDKKGAPFGFRDGQVWMIVVDDLDRVSWSAKN